MQEEIDKPSQVNRSGSKTATIALILGFLGVVSCGVTSIAGLVLGIVALVRLRKAGAAVDGRGMARVAIIVSIVTGALWFLVAVLPSRSSESLLLGQVHEVSPEDVLKSGRLAGLPVSATEVEAAHWSGIFTGESFLKFCASPEDIERFIKESPSLDSSVFETFSTEHMLLPRDYRSDENQYPEQELRKHEFYQIQDDTPEWYRPTIRTKGRRYEIPGKDHHNWGSVIVDDASNTVYINVIWS